MLTIRSLGVRGGFPTDEQMMSTLIIAEQMILLDCGSTHIFSDAKLLKELNLILISHLHSDHIAMLPHLILAKQILREKGLQVVIPTIYAPDSIVDLMNSMGLIEGKHYYWYNPTAMTIPTIHGFSVCNAKHTVPAFSYRLTRFGVTIVYTGDTSVHPELFDFCKNADVLICEASCGREHHDLSEKWGHMSPISVGRLIKETKPGVVLLTHFTNVTGEEFLRQLTEEINPLDTYLLVAHDNMELFFERPFDDKSFKFQESSRVNELEENISV